MTATGAAIVENPFYVLGLAADASRIEVERAAQTLLGMLELDFADVKSYATPVGPQPRTAEAVRAAVAALRDPYRRLVAEAWARHAPPVTTTVRATPPSATARPRLRRRLGWGP